MLDPLGVGQVPGGRGSSMLDPLGVGQVPGGREGLGY